MDEIVPPKAMRFSTESLPVRDRLPSWRDAFGRSILKLEMVPIEGRPFRESGTFHRFGSLDVVVSETNGHLSRRTKPLLADCPDDLVFITVLSGASVALQLGRETRVPAGSAVLLTSAEVGEHRLPGHTRFMTFRIPRRTLAPLLRDPEDRIAREVPASTEALGLLRSYVQTGLRQEPMSFQVRQAFAAHVQDLVALALGATREAAQLACGRGLRVARLDAVKAEISARLHEEGLTIGALARRQGVTPRYLQMLFEEDGTTFSQYLVKQRLAHAHRLLTGVARLERTITHTALAAGFGNLSHFNHVFRRHYGASPSEIRAAAQRAAE